MTDVNFPGICCNKTSPVLKCLWSKVYLLEWERLLLYSKLERAKQMIKSFNINLGKIKYVHLVNRDYNDRFDF